MHQKKLKKTIKKRIWKTYPEKSPETILCQKTCFVRNLCLIKYMFFTISPPNLYLFCQIAFVLPCCICVANLYLCCQLVFVLPICVCVSFFNFRDRIFKRISEWIYEQISERIFEQIIINTSVNNMLKKNSFYTAFEEQKTNLGPKGSLVGPNGPTVAAEDCSPL